MLQRLAIVSDIHGNLPALEAVHAAIRAEGLADAVVNLGDSLSGPLWPEETARWLMARAWPTLAGNHERQVLEGLAGRAMDPMDAHAAAEIGPATRAWMAGLPGTLWLADDVHACHGTPSHDLVYLLETVTEDHGRHGSRGIRPATAAEIDARLDGLAGGARASLILCGHSHLPRVIGASGGMTIVNPGSVGVPAYDDIHPHVHVVENGSPHARWAIVERTAAAPAANARESTTPARWSVALRATPYDHEAAARQAERNGRGDWADALRTGNVGRREADVLGC